MSDAPKQLDGIIIHSDDFSGENEIEDEFIPYDRKAKTVTYRRPSDPPRN